MTEQQPTEGTPMTDQRLTPGEFARMRAALGVMHAARLEHGEGLVPLARALEAAGLLQSPETAAELIRLRTERDVTSEALGKAVERIAELTEALLPARPVPPRTPVALNSPAARLGRQLTRTRTDVVSATPADATTLDLTVEPATWAAWEWYLKHLAVEPGQTTFRGPCATAKGQAGRVRVLLVGRGVPALYAAECDAVAVGAR